MVSKAASKLPATSDRAISNLDNHPRSESSGVFLLSKAFCIQVCAPSLPSAPDKRYGFSAERVGLRDSVIDRSMAAYPLGMAGRFHESPREPRKDNNLFLIVRISTILSSRRLGAWPSGKRAVRSPGVDTSRRRPLSTRSMLSR